MGLMDKIKSTFFYDDDEDQVKKEVIKVEIPAPSKEIKEPIEEPKAQEPVFFDEDDFINISKPLKEEPVEEKKEEPVIPPKKEPYKNENYRRIDDTPKPAKKFQPTPVISPVYGVLDKNYHKEDIVHKNEEKVYKDSDGMTIDDLRNKAFGTLEDELENTMVGSKNNVTVINNEEAERQDIFDDLELEMKQTADAIDLLDKNYDDFDETSSDNYEPQHIDSIKEEKITNNKDEDLFELIDSLYEKGDK